MEMEENVNPGGQERQFSKIAFENRQNMHSQIVACDSRDRQSRPIGSKYYMYTIRKKGRLKPMALPLSHNIRLLVIGYRISITSSSIGAGIFCTIQDSIIICISIGCATATDACLNLVKIIGTVIAIISQTTRRS
jgi:hypothetical protein